MKKFDDKIASLQQHVREGVGSEIINVDNIINPILEKFEPLMKLLESKENEISILQNELVDKNRDIEDYNKRYNDLTLDISRLKCNLDQSRNEFNEKKLKVEGLEDRIKHLDLQVTTINGQKNMLIIEGTDKSKKIQHMQTEIDNMSFRVGQLSGQNAEIQKSTEMLKAMVDNYLKNSKASTENVANENEAIKESDDVIIYHDSLFKHVSEGLLKKENLKVKKVWAPTLKTVLDFVTALQIKPKLVVVHSGTNDLGKQSNESIAQLVADIQEVLMRSGIKFVFSEIVPRLDELDFKAQVVNAMTYSLLANKDVTIAKNSSFYDRGVINKDLFEVDGVHITDTSGAGCLASNIRYAICRSLGIEPEKRPRTVLGAGYRRGKHNNNNYNNRKKQK